MPSCEWSQNSLKYLLILPTAYRPWFRKSTPKLAIALRARFTLNSDGCLQRLHPSADARGTMISLRVNGLTVEFDRDGDRNFNRGGIIDWLGKPVMIVSDPYTFHFDLEGRLHRIDGFPSPNTWDWVQRTMANDWIYYDKVWQPHRLPEPSGIIGDWAWAINGRTDLPILKDHDGLWREYVQDALAVFDTLISSVREILATTPEVRSDSGAPVKAEDVIRLQEFLSKVALNDQRRLQDVADRLTTIRGRMNVLPPDTIQVDYQALLVKVMDGCVNSCGFCVARGDSAFGIRDKDDIDRQIDATAEVYGADLYNYNSVVFGECDALASPLLEHAARRAFEVFRCGDSYHFGSNLFLFATNKTLCEQPDNVFEMLEALPFEKICVNVGWEAASDGALTALRKQQTAEEVFHGLERAGNINRQHKKVAISGNFILADQLECDSIAEALRKTQFCGQLYLSPLHSQCSSEKAMSDLRILSKAAPDVRVFLYTMQRM